MVIHIIIFVLFSVSSLQAMLDNTLIIKDKQYIVPKTLFNKHLERRMNINHIIEMKSNCYRALYGKWLDCKMSIYWKEQYLKEAPRVLREILHVRNEILDIKEEMKLLKKNMALLNDQKKHEQEIEFFAISGLCDLEKDVVVSKKTHDCSKEKNKKANKKPKLNTDNFDFTIDKNQDLSLVLKIKVTQKNTGSVVK